MATFRSITRTEDFSYSLEDVAALRELFKTLSNGVKAVVQYPPHHPIANGFKQVFVEKLSRFFQRNRLIVVTVEQDGIRCGVDVILKGDSDHDGIHRVLHRDGIRQLQILPQVTRREIDDLFAALAACLGPDHEQVDVVNYFWQAQFEGIRYEVVDMFEAKEITLGPETGQLQLSESDLHADPKQIERERNELQQQMIECFGNIAEFSQEHVEALQEMIEADLREDVRGAAIELLLQIYSSVDSLQDQVAAIECLKRILDKCIEQGRFRTLADIVRRGKQLLANSQGSTSSARGLSGFVLRCGDSIRLQMVTAALNRDEQIDLEPVAEYLAQLGPDSLNNLINMLGELEHYPARRMLCDHLTSQSSERVDIIGNAVFDRRWYLVRNVAWILGEVGGDRALDFLKRAAEHGDERVRAEVVKALGKIRSDESVKLLLTVLEDDSERISSMAANELGRSKSPLAFAALQGLVVDREFARFPRPRIRQLLEALVLCDGERSLATVRSLLKQSSIFGRARLRLVQEEAVNALQGSNHPGAIEFLESLANSKKSALSTVARKALMQLKYRLERSGDDAGA